MNKLGNIDILDASCNISTVQDGRGAIFTWLPSEPIVEFNMLYFHPNKIRGNHYHPEFTEYFLIVEGSVVMVTKDPVTKRKLICMQVVEHVLELHRILHMLYMQLLHQFVLPVLLNNGIDVKIQLYVKT